MTKIRGVNVWIILWLIGTLHNKNVQASGKLSLQFKEYENPTFDKDDMSCCTSSSEASSCRFHCDNKFEICVTDGPGTSPCNIVNYKSNTIQSDHIWFTQLDERLQSPYDYSFQKWNGKILFDIKVIDGHPSANILIVNFLDERNISAQTLDNKKWEDFKLEKGFVGHKKTLKLSMSVTCDEEYLAPACNIKYCVPHDDNTGHYNCSDMGEKICFDGWEEPTMSCLKKYCLPYDDDNNGHYNCSDMGEKICLNGWLDKSSNCTIKNAVLPNTKPSLNEDEVLTVPWMYIIIAVVVLFVVVALILTLVYCQRKRKSPRKAYTSFSDSNPSITPNINNNSKQQNTSTPLAWKDGMFSETVRYGL